MSRSTWGAKTHNTVHNPDTPTNDFFYLLLLLYGGCNFGLVKKSSRNSVKRVVSFTSATNARVQICTVITKSLRQRLPLIGGSKDAEINKAALYSIATLRKCFLLK